MNKITFDDVLKERNESNFKRSYFKHYCGLSGCCDNCDRRVRFICKIKVKLTELQNKIIEKL